MVIVLITSIGISLGFICIFLLTVDVKHFYMCLSAIHISSLKCVEIIPLFLTQLFVFLLLNYRDFLYIRTSIFMFCKYCLPVFGFSIYFLKDVFWRAENYNFQKIHLINTFFHDYWFLISKKLLSTPRLWKYSHTLSSKSFPFSWLVFMFRSLIYLELIYVNALKLWLCPFITPQHNLWFLVLWLTGYSSNVYTFMTVYLHILFFLHSPP